MEISKTHWELIRSTYGFEEGREMVEKHNFGLTVDEYDSYEMEFRRKQGDMPEVDVKDVIKEMLRDWWRTADERISMLWLHNDEMRASGVPFKERKEKIKEKRQKLNGFKEYVADIGKNLQVRSLYQVLDPYQLSHAKENPEEFIRSNHHLFICN